jgi:uncharacterized SAM-binding protein YcdF (DUF218 family)
MSSETPITVAFTARTGDPIHVKTALRVKRILRVLILLLVIWPVVAWIAARALIVSAGNPRADVIVVLGGSSTFVERTRYAAELFREGRAPRILLTNDGLQGGWSNADNRNTYFVERALWELQVAGVPNDKIEVLPQITSSTYEEAALLRQYAEAHAVRSVLVVTSAYHSRRAMWTFRRVFDGSGVEISVMSPPTGWQTPPPATWWLHKNGWSLVAGEYTKLVYYYLKY